MNIRPLTQLRELIATALKSQANIGKSCQSFFIETMELFLTHTGRLNFTRMARCGRSCESRFRQNFKKPFDWFWSGCAAAMKKGLEILGISIVDADAKDAVFLKAEQTFTGKKRGRKPKCTKGMDDPDSLTGWYLRMLTRNCKQLLSVCKLLVADTSMSAKDIFDIYKTRFQLEFVFRDAKQFPGLTHCQARNSQALSFAFNASLTSVNIAKAFASQQGMDLSVGSTKTLLHNAAMVERFISMSGKHADMRFNNTDFKELLFYGVRAAG